MKLIEPGKRSCIRTKDKITIHSNEGMNSQFNFILTLTGEIRGVFKRFIQMESGTQGQSHQPPKKN